MKFGGTSVGSAERIKGAAQIVASYAGTERVVVVVSAVSGVTDKLLAAARKAAAREHFEALELVLEIRSAHASIIEGLGLCDSEAALLRGDVQLIVGELQNFVQSISILGEVTLRTLDYVAGMGERLSSRLVSAALRNIECASEAVEATRFVVTDATFGNAYPLMEPTRARAAEVLGPLL
ncbi:MAG TPA: aspartate kinase, partial [Chloroflexia bacterium]|nr:aspartate kinase [Chloroflexia bacterium]